LGSEWNIFWKNPFISAVGVLSGFELLPKCPDTLWPDGFRDMTAEDEPEMGGMFMPFGLGELLDEIGRTED
jgi:hypothetical protein